MFNLDSYYPLPDSMYNCALSQLSHVDWQRFKEPLAQTLIQRTPWPRRGIVSLIGLVSIFRSPLAQTWIR